MAIFITGMTCWCDLIRGVVAPDPWQHLNACCLSADQIVHQRLLLEAAKRDWFIYDDERSRRDRSASVKESPPVSARA